MRINQTLAASLIVATLFSLHHATQATAAPEKSTNKNGSKPATGATSEKSKTRLKALLCHNAAQKAFKQYQADLKEGNGRHYYDVLDPGREAYRLAPDEPTFKKALIQYLLTVGEFQNKDDGPEIASETFKEVLKIEPGNETALKFMQSAAANKKAK